MLTCFNISPRAKLIDDKKLQVAIKHEKIQPYSFYKDYLFEALFTKRLNMAGCNDIITVIDVSPWAAPSEVPLPIAADL